MYCCMPCRAYFRTWKSFKRHMLEEHSVNERNLARRAAQLAGSEVFALRSEAGHWYLMGQPVLF